MLGTFLAIVVGFCLFMLFIGEREQDRSTKLAAEMGLTYGHLPDANEYMLRAFASAPSNGEADLEASYSYTKLFWNATDSPEPPSQCAEKNADPASVTIYGCEIFDSREVREAAVGKLSAASKAKRSWVPEAGGNVGVCSITEGFGKAPRTVDCYLAR